MKKLTKIKLVNWHYFNNETIIISESSLLSGDNGSGKSTILDALQYVLTCGKAKFNTAAHENTKRNLLGYVRCKTGRDNMEYQRTGNVTTHVSLEFTDSKNKKLIIGTVIDSADENSLPKNIFYIIEDVALSDNLFFDYNKKIFNIHLFKKYNRNIKVLQTQKEARKEFNNKCFGGIENRFFELISKALAFKPMNNVRDFVCSYLLDAKELNIEHLRNNIIQYKEYENYLRQTKEKVEKLASIIKHKESIDIISQQILLQEYIIYKAKTDNLLLKINKISKEEKFKKDETEKIKQQLYETENSIDEKKNIAQEIEISLRSHDTYQLKQTLETELNRKLEILNETEFKCNELDDYVNSEIEKAKNIFDVFDKKDLLKMFYKLSGNLIDKQNIEDYNSVLFDLDNEYKLLYNQWQNEKFHIEQNLDNANENLNGINNCIEQLKKGELIYPEKLFDLKKIIEDEIFNLHNKKIELHILCRLLEIKDKKWTNAIESLIYWEKFSLLVDKKYFKTACIVYEKFKSDYNFHSFGLIKTGFHFSSENVLHNSIANIIISRTEDAKNYINKICGDFVCADTLDELFNSEKSVSSDCFVFKDNRFFNLFPEKYRLPYIGESALETQLNYFEKEKQNTIIVINNYKKKLYEISGMLKNVSNSAFEKIRNLSDSYYVKSIVENDISKIKLELSSIDTSDFLDMQRKLDRVNEEISILKSRKEDLRCNEIQYEKKLSELETNLKIMNNDYDDAKNVLDVFLKDNEYIIPTASKKYMKEKQKKDYQTIIDNFTIQIKGRQTAKERIVDNLKEEQQRYNNEHQFGASIGIEGLKDYVAEHLKLKESGIVEYEEKVKKARENSEQEFKEQFLSKLRENIETGENEFKKLNLALKDIKFGNDEYKFHYSPSAEYRDFYEMIMDDNNISGYNLFSDTYRDKHEDIMNDLFDKLVSDYDENNFEIKKLIDYRNYMDYDIKIIHSDGTRSSFSKVCREKSGGETQVPYYVIIAASFKQLYDNAHYSEPAGIILFDEAFDKLDDLRIESMMTFLKNLDLQIVMAVPPQKVEDIGPFINTVLVVNYEPTLKSSFITNFSKL